MFSLLYSVALLLVVSCATAAGDSPIKLDVIIEDVVPPPNDHHVYQWKVRCDVDIATTNISDISSVFLLTPSRYGVDMVFNEVASVTPYGTPQVVLDDVDKVNINVTGKVGVQSDTVSYLMMTWRSRSMSFDLPYKCVARGFAPDQSTRSISIIKAAKPDIRGRLDTIEQMLVNLTVLTEKIDVEIQDVDRQVKDIDAALAQQSQVLSRLEQKVDSGFSSVDQKLEVMETAISENMTRLETKVDALAEKVLYKQLRLGAFHVTNSLNDTVYLVNRWQMTFDVQHADYVCGTLGGYLVEFDSKQEYDFVMDEMSSIVQLREIIMTGLVRDANNQWQYYHSKKPLDTNNSPWLAGEPNNISGNENCVNLYSQSPTGINDVSCNIKARFICEIPLIY